MSAIVTETRNFNFDNVIVTADDIRGVSSVIEAAAKEYVTDNVEDLISDYLFVYKKLTEDEKEKYKDDFISDNSGCAYYLRSANKSQYVSRGSEILSIGYLENEFIESISIEFNLPRARESIKFSIVHDPSSYSTSNSLSVTGVDSTWVNGVFIKIKNRIETFEKQSVWVRKYSLPIKMLTAILLGWHILIYGVFFATKTGLYIPKNNGSSEHGYGIYFALMGVGFFIGIIPAELLISKLEKLWPSVEIRTGREYMQIARRRRSVIWSVITILVIPLIFEWLF